MSRKKMLERKKQKRENTARERVLYRREQHRAQSKWMREQELKAKLITKMESKYPEQMKRYEREDLMKLPLETLKQIEHNVRILQALEDEHTREVDARNKMNEELESMGHITPEDKIKSLSPQQIQEMLEAENKKVSMGGSAECSFKVNKPKKPKKDTADVEVFKLPQDVVEDSGE